MGGDGSKEVHYYHTSYQVPPETQSVLDSQAKQLKIFEEEAMVRSDPKLFEQNAKKLMEEYLDKLPRLKLTDIIKKETGETHIGFIGQISAGKTTLINTMYGLKLPVALGHCTEECMVVHKEEHNVIWDVCGYNDDYRFYKPENLSFIKNLDVCVILFDNDVKMINNILKVVQKINPESMVIIRTKVDQHTASSVRTVEEERILDTRKVEEIIGVPKETYCISSHNVEKRTGKYYDWEKIKEKIRKM